MNKITIIIPTYNRSKFLDESLKKLSVIEKNRPFNLIICNNASTDDTNIIIKKWEKHFNNIKIINQEKNMGYDYNVATGYYNVNTDYCWLLGDSYYISEEDFESISNYINDNNLDSLIIKTTKRNKFPTQTFVDLNDLLSTQGWHITNLCSCIISKNFIIRENIEKYIGSYFVHTGTFIEYLSQKNDIKVIYDNRISIKYFNMPNLKKESWNSTPFTIFGKYWYLFVISLPTKVALETKRKMTLDHNKYTHLFYPKKVFRNIKKNNVNYKTDYYNNRDYMKFISSTPLWIYDLIMKIRKSKKE